MESDSRILAIDDQAANLAVLKAMLEPAGYTDLLLSTDPEQGLELVIGAMPDVILLDLHMPRLDGFELLRRIRASRLDHPPIIVLTADVSSDARHRALDLGARDFLTKPLDRVDVVMRVRNALEVRALQLELERRNFSLGEAVAIRTRELEESRLDVVDRLATAAEYRDDDTQEHARRIGRSARRLGGRLGMPGARCELIGRAATLHDVGKIGVPDAILLKPGRLTADETAQMREHAAVGAAILGGSRSALLATAAEIAHTHHERWDGRGYPRGLAGPEIPLSGRIVAVADVFDALTHARPYKAAWPLDEAVTEIAAGSDAHFDPAVVAAFLELDHAALLAPIDGEEAQDGADDAGSLLFER